MVWPTWLWIGTPLKLTLWLVNRFLTWTGVAYVWRRFRSRKHFWVWLLLLNLMSLGALGLLFFWLHLRSTHGKVL